MAQSEDNAHSDAGNSLGESEDVRRIKEEWTRLQMAMADGRLFQEGQAGEEDQELRAERKKELESQVARGGGKKPPSRLPSLDSMVGYIPSIPSMEISTGLGKKLPDLGSVGHRLGIMADPKDLEPQAVALEKTAFSFGANTPTQTDIKWTPPANAANFKSISYDVEVDSGQGWNALSGSRLPLLRAYYTSQKLLIGRFSRVQQAEPVAVRLRVRATGTVKGRTQEEEAVNGPWSEDIWLSLEGSTVTSNTAV